jgi:hypothetical protein
LPALGIQQQPSVLDNYGKVMQLKNIGLQQQSTQQEMQQRAALMPGQQQLQQAQITGAGQQVQLGQQEIQKNQIALNDQKILSQLYPQFGAKPSQGGSAQPSGQGGAPSAGYDYNGLKAAAIDKGVSFNGLSQINAIQSQNADLAIKMAGAGEAAIKLEQTKNDALNKAVESLQAIPDLANRRAAVPGVIAPLQQMGIDTSKLTQADPTDANLASAQTTLGVHQEVVDEAKKLADMYKAKAGEKGSPEEQSLQAYMDKNPGKTPLDYAVMMKKIVPAYNFNLQNQGATGTPTQPSAIAKGIADGSVKWQDVVSARTPMAVKQQLLTEVKGIKPDFNSGDFSIEQSVKKEFTSGDAAKSLTAFNTAIEHAKQLGTAADALNNGDMPTVNKLTNAIGYQTGSDKTTNFNVIKNALTGEISKVFKGGGATDAEIEAVQGPFSSANSPAQLKGAINNAVQLMNSKREALQQQYQAGSQAKPNFGGGAGQGGGGQQFKAPADAPPPPKEDGHKLKANGQVIAVSKGGQWVAP